MSLSISPVDKVIRGSWQCFNKSCLNTLHHSTVEYPELKEEHIFIRHRIESGEQLSTSIRATFEDTFFQNLCMKSLSFPFEAVLKAYAKSISEAWLKFLLIWLTTKTWISFISLETVGLFLIDCSSNILSTKITSEVRYRASIVLDSSTCLSSV